MFSRDLQINIIDQRNFIKIIHRNEVNTQWNVSIKYLQVAIRH